MERVTLPNLPERRAADFQLDGFDPPRYARVIYVPQESKPDRRVIEAQAFEVDAAGNFATAPNGAPSRTPGTQHTIHMSGIGDTHTIAPGWVRVAPDSGVNYTAENVPDGTLILDTLPADGAHGDLVYVEPNLYRWDRGILETIMMGKAQDLAGLLRNSLAAAAALDL